MSQPNLTGLHLFSRDVSASVAFYRLMGLPVPGDAVWATDSGAHHVTIPMAGGCSLEIDSYALTRAYDAGWQEPGAGPSAMVFSFSVDSRDRVDETYSRLVAAGHRGHLAPFDAFWGARYAVVEDPDGNQVGLMSPRDPARGTAPPSL